VVIGNNIWMQKVVIYIFYLTWQKNNKKKIKKNIKSIKFGGLIINWLGKKTHYGPKTKVKEHEK
jgi:hypothetical protein